MTSMVSAHISKYHANWVPETEARRNPALGDQRPYNSGHSPVNQPQKDTGGVVVEISEEARELGKSTGADSTAGAPGSEESTESEKKEVKELQATDREVRAHEQAHKAAAGNLARGGVSYEYQTGPDGRRYAVGGEVNISTGGVEGNPRATIQKANQIRPAALAPADPSGQDRRVAAEATAMANNARRELPQQEDEGSGKPTSTISLYA